MVMPRLKNVPLDFQPGTRWAYSAQYGFDVLARVVEVASGHAVRSLHEAAHHRSARDEGHLLLSGDRQSAHRIAVPVCGRATTGDGVGLIPGGAGTLNMLWRALEGVPEGVDVDTYAFVTQVFKNIALAKVATSAEEAKAFGYFRTTDGVSFDRARQLHEAKQRAHRPRRRRLPPAGAARLQAARRERHRDAAA